MKGKKLSLIKVLFIILIILLAIFAIKVIWLKTDENSGNGLIDKLLGTQYDDKFNKKDFGSTLVKKDDRGNHYIYLNTGMKKLDSAIEKVVNDYRTNAVTYEKYSIDCSSKIYFNNIYEVTYMLLKDNNPKSDIIKTTRIYYSKNIDDILDVNKILRNNYVAMAQYEYPDLKFDNIDVNNFKLNEKEIVLGRDDKKITLEYNKCKDLFKAGTGIPCDYDGEVIKQKIIPIDPNKKHIAFTFDDGPLNKNHERIRELFNEYNQQATFFMVGTAISENPQMLIKTYKDGHMIANHSWSHPDFTRLTPQEQAKEIFDTSNIIFKDTGYDIEYVRPPYGAYNETTKKLTNGNIALWNVDSLDWKNRDVNMILNEVRPYCADGAIVLFHDLYDTSYEAVKILVPELIDKGFQFVRYDTLLNYEAEKGNKK